MKASESISELISVETPESESMQLMSYCNTNNELISNHDPNHQPNHDGKSNSCESIETVRLGQNVGDYWEW